MDLINLAEGKDKEKVFEGDDTFLGFIKCKICSLAEELLAS